MESSFVGRCHQELIIGVVIYDRTDSRQARRFEPGQLDPHRVPIVAPPWIYHAPATQFYRGGDGGDGWDGMGWDGMGWGQTGSSPFSGTTNHY